MAYCTIKTMSQTRGKAMRVLILERQSIQKVADKYGVHRTTIWRWKQKWLEQNRHSTYIMQYGIRMRQRPSSDSIAAHGTYQQSPPYHFIRTAYLMI